MGRDQALTLVKLYDGQYPEEYENEYLNYFQLNKKKFHKILDKWANKKIFKKQKNKWVLKREIN